MFVHSREIEITVTSGAGADVATFAHEHVKQIVVVPPSESAVYDFSMENKRSVELFDADDVTGSYNETTDHWFKDMFTLRIANSTEDGVFTITIISYEPHK